MNLACNPTSTKQQFDEAHFAPWDTEKLIPEINLLQFMELQRRKPYDDSHPPKYLIGYALPTTVDRNGATQQKIHTWPEDKIGDMIKPAPIDWAKWRTEREASFRDNAVPSRGAGLPVVAKRNSVTAAVQPLNGQQRRRLKALGR